MPESRHLSPYRHALDAANAALLAALSRGSGGADSIETGESAQKVSYLKSLVTHRAEGEDDRGYANRHLAMHFLIVGGLPSALESPQEPPTPIRRPRGRAAS